MFSPDHENALSCSKLALNRSERKLNPSPPSEPSRILFFGTPAERSKSSISKRLQRGLLTLGGVFGIGEGHLFHRGSTVHFV
jgi:hypothetical protein